jgi:hypothetical protein
MRCISCDIEINPKWKHAIDNNACPMCGDPIMDEGLKSLLTTLQATMEQLESYPEQVNDWLFSNFSYIKTDASNLVDFVPKELLASHFQKRKQDQDSVHEKHSIKVKTEHGEQDVLVEKIQDDEKTSQFFKRAENNLQKSKFESVADRTAYIKTLKRQIENGETPNSNAQSDGFVITDSSDLPNQNMDMDIDLYTMAQESEALSNFPGSMGDEEDDEDRIPSVVANMARKAAGNKNPQKDIDLLKQMHDKLNDSKRNFNGGGGSFTR